MSSPGESFRPGDRVRRRSEFLRIQKEGRRVHTPHFVLLVMPNDEGPRLGITVSKKVCNAVRRNRIRRVAREVFRRNRALFPDRGDVVMIARTGADRLGYREVREEVARTAPALRRAAASPPREGPANTETPR
jgi:ribonuclease P protein component